MNNDINLNKSPRNNRALAGLFLIALGGIYLFRQFDFFFFPNWLFSWPMILIVIGIFSGIKHNFRNPGWLIMVLIGTFFLLNHLLNFHLFLLWPVLLIAIGIHMITRKNDERWCRSRWERRTQWRQGMYHNDEPTIQ